MQKSIGIIQYSSILTQAYLDSSTDSVEGQFEGEGKALGEGGQEEGEDQFYLFFVSEAINQLGGLMHQNFVDVDVESCGDKRMRKGETDAPIERPSLSLE